MRLHWFLPSLRKDGRPRRPGPLRRVLGWIGPTWAASPVRRLVQTLSFGAFLWLFLYVCWPYTARPARVWHNWLPVEVDAETGQLTLALDQPPAEPLPESMAVHVLDAGAAEEGYLGRFAVQRAGPQELALVPAEPLRPEQLDRLSASFGPWSLWETDPRRPPSHYADSLDARESILGFGQSTAAETFLIVDPLVSLSTALAARWWVWSLAAAGVILLVCLVIPRGFCAYVCPLGTLVDLFDWAIGKRLRIGGRRASAFDRPIPPHPGPLPPGQRETALRPAASPVRVRRRGWWASLKYYLLVATLTASLLGVLITGFVAAIPVVTRGMAFLLAPLQMGVTRGWHQIPAMGAGHYVSIAMFLLTLGLGLLSPRFWCKYVCPTGAVFSVANFFRLTERKVESSCIRCKRCVAICPFDAIQPDFTTRGADCTFCQACGGVCPTQAIKFVQRWNRAELKGADDPRPGEGATGRRRFLAATVGLVAGAAGGGGLAAGTRLLADQGDDTQARPIVRPPGSVPEREFLRLCVRCGECFQACPNNVLQPAGFDHGWEALWTPQVAADWSGCEPSCANCGRVCPTGAIRALSLEEKRVARMGLAVVDKATCLPYAGREDCQVCVDECAAAGYQAIEFVRVGTEMDPLGQPVEGTGLLAPVVLAEKCVGCGLCQTRCRAVNVKAKGLLAESAIKVEAGGGKEDRLMRGSYLELRAERQRQKEAEQRSPLDRGGPEGGYLPDFLD